MNARPAAVAEYLPPSARELAEVIGLAALQRLVAWRGGRRLWVPSRLDPDHPLIEAIGPVAAAALHEWAPAQELDIPRCAHGARILKDIEIRRRYAAGETAGALAGEYGCTERTIWAIVAKAAPGEPSRQGELFP